MRVAPGAELRLLGDFLGAPRRGLQTPITRSIVLDHHATDLHGRGPWRPRSSRRDPLVATRSVPRPHGLARFGLFPLAFIAGNSWSRGGDRGAIKGGGQLSGASKKVAQASRVVATRQSSLITDVSPRHSTSVARPAEDHRGRCRGSSAQDTLGTSERFGGAERARAARCGGDCGTCRSRSPSSAAAI